MEMPKSCPTNLEVESKKFAIGKVTDLTRDPQYTDFVQFKIAYF
jgi:hypothetical protein